MNEWRSLVNHPIVLIGLMIGFFEMSAWLRLRTGWQLFNPTLITTVALVWLLIALDIPWESFEKASDNLTFWLQPAVVCLAVPLYVQWQKIKAQWLPILASQIIGSTVGVVSGVYLAKVMGGSDASIIALATKSVTMPIAVEVTQKLNGVVGITAAGVLVAGVVGQVMGIFVLHHVKSKKPMSQGLSMGTASHALGTVRVMQMGQRYVAYATVGLILNGVMTAFLAPILVPLLA